jgi:hypothetical protein
VRYALYDVTSTNARGVGNLNAPSGSTGLDNIDQSLAVGNVWALSGTGSDFFSMSLRVSRSFHIGGGRRIEGLVEVFNLTDHVNAITRNTTFGPGSYPSNPVPAFNTVTAVGDPRTLQFGVRMTF